MELITTSPPPSSPPSLAALLAALPGRPPCPTPTPPTHPPPLSRGAEPEAEGGLHPGIASGGGVLAWGGCRQSACSHKNTTTNPRRTSSDSRERDRPQRQSEVSAAPVHAKTQPGGPTQIALRTYVYERTGQADRQSGQDGTGEDRTGQADLDPSDNRATPSPNGRLARHLPLFTQTHDPGPKAHKHRPSRRERQRRQSEVSAGSQEGECEDGLWCEL